MKIIILAAGKGERLMPLTRNTPKPLLDMGNGSTLLEEQISNIQESGVIDEIVLVIGYLAEQVEAKIKLHLINGINIKTVFNPFYEVSNNLMSLWLTKHEMDDDFMVTNGDNLFSPEVFKGLVEENSEGIFLSVSIKDKYDYDDMKVTLQDNLVARVNKRIEIEETHGESPGLAMLRGARARNLFKDHLEILARNKRYINTFWLEVFNLLYERGIPVNPWMFDGTTQWQEVDFHVDVEKVKSVLQPKMKLFFSIRDPEAKCEKIATR